jgi:hypothetical protein
VLEVSWPIGPLEDLSGSLIHEAGTKSNIKHADEIRALSMVLKLALQVQDLGLPWVVTLLTSRTGCTSYFDVVCDARMCLKQEPLARPSGLKD